MRTLGTRFCRDERGATAIEYGLICGLIFLAIITSLSLMANNSNGLLNDAMGRISDALSGGDSDSPPSDD